MQYIQPVNELTNAESVIVGVDVGGTKIAAGIVDAHGQVIGQVMTATDTQDPERTLHSIASAVRECIETAGIAPARVRAVGLGIPGMVDPERGVCLLSVNLNWQNVAVRSWLEQELNLPCVIDNDVCAATLGESIYGAGRGARNMVYLSLGTGIAARAIMNGQLYRGAHGMAGEVGHLVVMPDGPLCRCGACGCLEALAAGPALALSAQTAIAAGQETQLKSYLQRQGTLRSEDVFAAAADNDGLALRILRQAGKHIAYGIYLLAMTFDPQIIVIGGGLTMVPSPLLIEMRARAEYLLAQSSTSRTMFSAETLCISSMGRDCAIIGAAALVARSNGQHTREKQ
ncbi:ROK family protein [Dictyobacter aurantiacus]|uniref:Glucokinase n=1 Tax=Dictyobacter aurantiacus TaxID=1936993 RepID=A0A401ZRH3_9CHLR|nr:ROK family protein [Dictyobacter aurantiacus]GCE09453.1 glucokinase [Dictyobacter aurantiacus]